MCIKDHAIHTVSGKMNLTLLLTVVLNTTHGRVNILTMVNSLLGQAADSHRVSEPPTGAQLVLADDFALNKYLDHPNNLHDENRRLKRFTLHKFNL